MQIKKTLLVFLIVGIILLQSSIIFAQDTESEDIKYLGAELEKLVMLITGVIALVLFIFTFVAYKRDKRPKLFYISIAFLLFAIKSFMLSSELFVEPTAWLEPLAIALELLALISFFYGVLRK